VVNLRRIAFPRSKSGIFDLTLNKLKRFEAGSYNRNFSFILDRNLQVVYKFLLKRYLRPLKNGNFCSSSRKAKISTTGIYRIFRGLKFEPDAEIGQKVPFCKGLTLILPVVKD